MDGKIFTMICAYMRIFARIAFSRIWRILQILRISQFSKISRQILSLSLIFALGGGILGNSLFAKEPANWLFGVGFGAGQSQIDEKYPEAARNQLGINWKPGTWIDLNDSTTKGWGFAWEILAGYKHFLNDFVGFRYYANISGQQYKDEIFTAGKVKAGVYEYTANADLLLNFYTSQTWTFGLLAGFGVGGAYFDSDALDTYKARWSQQNPQFADARYEGLGNIKKHHLSANLSVGARFNILQKIRQVGKRVCDNRDSAGRRTCRVPISYLEHGIEFNAKFPMLTYYATDKGDVIGAYCSNSTDCAGKFATVARRPGYEVKNPYKLTLRYVIAF